MSDYIKRQDAVRAMAQYLMDIALIDNPEASDHIEEWESSIAAPVMSTVEAADVVEVVRCKDCEYFNDKWKQCWFFGDIGSCPEVSEDDYCSYGERREE